jgi:serine/threonine-protein kinase ULK/ATG1
MAGRDKTGRPVAVKALQKARLKPKQLAALQEEVQLMRTITCEHIIQLYDVCQSQHHYYLIMEYCSGGDLEHIRGRRLDECTVQRLVHDVSRALKTLHEHSIMHRDLKLGNLLLSSKHPGAVVKLADFGLARRLREDEKTSTYCGTLHYMAPEILAGDAYGLKADLWSLGVLIFVFLTGKFPFDGTTPYQLLVSLNQGIAKLPPDVVLSERCFDVLKKLLRVDPKSRIEWKDYFEHPFVASPAQDYAAQHLSQTKSAQIGYINSSIRAGA